VSMKTGISRWGAPKQLVCALSTTGSLPNHTPGEAYSGIFDVTGANGDITATLVSADPPLPAGWTLSVNQSTDEVTLAWPGVPAGGAEGESILSFDTGDGTADRGGSPLTWSRAQDGNGGILPVVSSAQSKFGGASAFFDASTTTLATSGRYQATVPGSPFSSDFTIEAWVYRTANNNIDNAFVIGFADGGATLDGILLNSNSNTAQAVVAGSPGSGWTLPLNQWVHVVWQRSGNQWQTFSDGVLRENRTVSYTPGAGCTARIGFRFRGYVDEHRITLGEAVYPTTGFTPPGAPFPSGPGVSSLPNLDFETGDIEWLKGNRWAIDTSGLKDGGTWSAKYDGPGQSTIQHSQAVPVTPGTSITASCRISKGNNREDFAGGAVVLQWLDAAYNVITFDVGNVVNVGSAAFQTSTVTATAPIGSAFVRLAASASRDVRGRARDKVYADNFVWNHGYAIPAPPGVAYDVVIRVRDGRGCQATLSQTIGSGSTVRAKLAEWWDLATQVTGSNPSFGYLPASINPGSPSGPQPSEGNDIISGVASVPFANGPRGAGDNAVAVPSAGILTIQGGAPFVNFSNSMSWATFGWVYWTGTPSGVVFCFWDQQNAQGCRATMYIDGTQLLLVTGGTQYFVLSTARPAGDQWHFIVAWRDSADGRIYLQINNGAVIQGPVTSGAFDPNTERFFLGNFPSTLSPMSGRLSRWGVIRNGLLTPAERTFLYNSGLGRNFSET